MSAVVGLAGLQPTIDAIKISKTVALANKETIICAWHILSRLIKKYKTEILPVDSEHFSIMELTKNIRDSEVDEIIITASGGPFLNTPINKLNYATPKQATNHPNWKMGKKISIDSANMMNKVFEVIEAWKLFKFNKKKYKVIIHPQSHVHSIIRFKNGLTKMILYNTDMKIPISNTLYGKKNVFSDKSKIDTKILNSLNFKKIKLKNFPSIKLINKCLNSGYSTPIIVNASNEVLVNFFLKGKIGFLDIVKTINEIFNDKDFNKYAKRKPNSVKGIKIIDNWARLKTTNMCVI
jgi:1-deoxy-D-xylulose-5-phosphate reductoisomerase